ncbi:per1-like family protein [Striga asiatica]|uniref:Post-GPI attachment to proteins factor 3 n=1 Tax=Striga asiatica TaxID=4170 RepID=A0A5A7R0I0_STRAF|nr:per1-like family protein [Striga asiatica]
MQKTHLQVTTLAVATGASTRDDDDRKRGRPGERQGSGTERDSASGEAASFRPYIPSNLMARHPFVFVLVGLSCFAGFLEGSPGDADPMYKILIKWDMLKSEGLGLVFKNVRRQDVLATNVFNTVIFQLMGHRLMGHGICRSRFMYSGNNGTAVVTVVIIEPVSVAFSALNLAVHFHGWVSFFILVNYKLPHKQNKNTYYEYTGLWHIYAVFAMNAWIWSAVFHSRDVDLTERLDYSSAVALLGYSLILAVIRAFNVRLEAARVMIAAPLLAFTATHILYLNFYQLDYGKPSAYYLLLALSCW